MTICRYYQQGTCRFGNRCRYEHVFDNNNSYGGGYAGGGGNFGAYRSGGSSGYGSNSYNYGGSYGSGGGGGGSSEGGNDRGVSILRAKAGTQYPQASSSLFSQPPATNSAHYQTSGSFFTSSVPDQKPAPGQREVKDIMQMIINEFTLWERSGQWLLSCFCLFKEQGCFPGLIDYSPEEIRWYMYQARTMGNLEECQQLIKGIYDKAKLVREQLITPTAEVFELLTRLSRGEKVETPAVPSVPSKPISSSSIFGNASGGNMQTSSQATSFTFTLPNKAPPTVAQNFSGFGVSQAPQTNAFANTFPNPVFSNVTASHSSPSIFGGGSATQTPQVAHPFSTPAVGNGFIVSNSNVQSVSDPGIYTPMEEATEDMLNAFNAPVYTMGSVPSKPPPMELCGLRS